MQGAIGATDISLFSHGWQSSKASCFQCNCKSISGGVYISHDAHVQRYKWSLLLHNHAVIIYKMWGEGERTWGGKAWPPPSWRIALSPHSTPSGSLASHPHSPSAPVFPWPVTPRTLGSTSRNSSKGYNNKGLACKHTPNTQQNSMPGITWNSSYCNPCPPGARRATRHMLRAFIFHDQVQSIICPCEIAGKLPQGQLHSCGFFIKDPQNPHRHWVHPFKEGIFSVFTAHPCDCTFLNLRTKLHNTLSTW